MAPGLTSDGVLLLDGGLATELESMGYDLNHKLWSAKLVLESPQAIVEAHLAYLRAGAQCIISSSYQASIIGFMTLGLSRPQAEKAIVTTVELAHQAVEVFCEERRPQNRPLVAASIGPYGAYCADGSEYHGNYQVKDDVLFDFHRERLEILSGTDADYLACETIPSLQEAKVLNKLLAEQRTPSWVCFSCCDQDHLNDGHPIADVGPLFANNSKVEALGVNCSAPQFINGLLDQLKTRTNKALIVYPNSGECFHAASKTWQGTANPIECAQAALAWRAHGARIIGGCCRMGPEHIAAMRKALVAA